MSILGDFRASSAGRQLLVVGLAVAVLCGVLFTAYFMFFRTSYSPLFTNLRTMDAATIVADLDKKKVPYKLQDGGATILVPSNVVDTTRLSVMSEDLPLKGTVGFELFNKSDMGLTEFAQKINYQRALQGELARTIMTMDAIDSARVHLSLPEPTIFRDDRRPPKASVTLATRPGQQLSAGTVRGIRRLVAAAIPDLDLANVVILDEHGEVVSNDIPVDTPISAGAQTRRAIEAYYAARIRRGLEGAYPNGEVEVSILPPQDTGAALQDSDPVLQSWTPGDRRFRLGVTVGVAGLLAPQVQAEVRMLAAGAGQLHLDAGDVVMVTTARPAAAANPAEEASEARLPPHATLAVAAPPRPGGGPLGSLAAPSRFWLTASAVLLVLLLAAALLLARARRAAPRALTEQQRLAYTDRLRTVLEKGEVNAARQG